MYLAAGLLWWSIACHSTTKNRAFSRTIHPSSLGPPPPRSRNATADGDRYRGAVRSAVLPVYALGLLSWGWVAACDRPTADSQPPVPADADATPSPSADVPARRPRVVVVIVVDQMRADYFDRFEAQLQGGLARLAESGVFFTDAHHAHAITNTAPGHASISTGTFPSHHGIVSNTWLDHATGRKVMAVDDPAHRILGQEGPGISPKHLLRPAIGDWVQATHPESVVVSLSLKDRAAMMLGGLKPDGAYWFEDGQGAYTTSTWYRDELPAWVRDYDETARARVLYGEGWVPLLDDATYGISRAVTDKVNEYGDYALTTRFPHTITREGVQPENTIRQTPFGDQMTLELARAAIDGEQIGADTVPDLLLISLSGGDYVGHRYGPYSWEMHDYYLRMDRYLGEFLTELDERFGDDYVVVFSSDHGVAPYPEVSDVKSAGRWDPKSEVPKLVDKAAKKSGLKRAQRPAIVWTHGVETVFPDGVDVEAQVSFRVALAEQLRALPQVADAFTVEQMRTGLRRGDFAQAWMNSFVDGRSPDILVQLAEGVLPYPAGSTHGTPYPYDTHVPLVVMGSGYDAAKIRGPVRTVDIAPTIAEIVGAEVPDGVDGKPLVLRQP